LFTILSRFSGGEINDLYEFRITIRDWRLLQASGTLPGSRSALGMTAVAGRIIIFGGSGGTGLQTDMHKVWQGGMKMYRIKSREDFKDVVHIFDNGTFF
jgi:hypothetical protein